MRLEYLRKLTLVKPRSCAPERQYHVSTRGLSKTRRNYREMNYSINVDGRHH